jgi:uracil-DNA glycosylase family 4
VSLNQRIVACTRCPRLIEYCAEVARTKRRAYRDETYWGKPVPSFGVAQPRLLVVGLAPGAHGANRTGRMFTGDSSGDWLYRALHEHGFANQAESTHRRDGLKLLDTRITAAAHCAPPGNKPSRDELDACRPYLVEEMGGLRRLRVVLALGKIAFDAVRKAWDELERPAFEPKPKFAHRAEAVSGDVTLLCSYHPSRQNTQTGRLTRAMWHGVFRRARHLLDA